MKTTKEKISFKSSSSSFPNPDPHPFSNPKPHWIYDVFINFRGKDTRRNFVSHLHYALSKAGLNTFLDDENLQKGKKLEELMQAIELSQIAIVVFSKSYAESTWCLDELEKIIECHEAYGLCVVPVFYYIDPSDVRHLKGEFAKALNSAAQKRLSREQLKNSWSKWKQSLTKAASIAGWDVRNFRNEAELVEEIVNDILNKLDYNPLFITKFPVGLGSGVQRVIGFIEKQSSKICIIGIWGMGGSGKTTIAKAIYNKIHRRFTDKSFIEDIREVCQTDRKGLVRLQKKLLSDILKTKVKIHSVGMGTTMIKIRLSGKRMLIVLDDVNEFGQVQYLCGSHEWFGKGTVIIITSRDRHPLDRFKVNYVYEMDKMENNECLELFSWHAFGEAKPKGQLNELARNVVAYCEGLPLALEVLGSYLAERTKNEWESVLSKLERIPNDKVQEKLRISFDGLGDHMLKDIFLDVCCFFIGKDRAYVTDILNGCGLYANIGITVLIERSLIKVEKNKLGMHHLLQDMGREIICESSRNEPWKRNRLWFQEDVLDVLTNNTGTEAIEGLALKLHSLQEIRRQAIYRSSRIEPWNLNLLRLQEDVLDVLTNNSGTKAIKGLTLKLPFTSRDCFQAYAFKEMKRLRLLQLDHVLLIGDYGNLSKQLRWICWKGFTLKYIPNNFDLKRVIVIDLRHSYLRLVWKKTQVLLWLKILNLSHSKYLTKTPDFSGLPSLEKLILKDCPSLCMVHQSIGGLDNLLLINLKDCTSLSNLPREIYKLKSLQTLMLSGCSKIDKLEEDIVQMESMTTLMAENTAVKQVPFSIVRLKSIGYMSLCGYKGLSRNVFPSVIWSWMSPTMNLLFGIQLFSWSSLSLVSINMQNNDIDDLVPMLSNLSNLRRVLVVCDTKCRLSKQLGTILDYTELEITSDTSKISKHSLKSYLFGIGSYKQVWNTLRKNISEGLATNEASDVFLPGDNYPYWLAHAAEGHSVYFTVPEDCRMKGIILCVVYLSTPEKIAIECHISVAVVNHTKCTMQIYKLKALISLNDEDWKGIISHLGPGDKVEIFVIFGHTLVVKKTGIYIIYDESIDKEMKPVSKPPIKNVYSRRRKNGNKILK